MMNVTAELTVPPVVTPQIDTTAATPSLTTFGDHMQTLNIIRRKSKMQAVTFRPGSSQMQLGSGKPQLHNFVPVVSPEVEPDWTLTQDAKPVEPVSVYTYRKHA
jgi:hypothetical protein